MTVDRYTEPQRTREVVPAPDTAPATHRTNSGTTDLMRWAEQAQAAHQLAHGICETTFVPQQYRGKPMEAAAAILAGAELGFSPMAALRTFDNIQGTAAPKAITHRAVVQAQGHDIWVVEQTPERAVVRGRRNGATEVVESVWTIERAKGLGLTGKDNWKKQPSAMLVARATSECARFVASDALLGMPYSSEEIADDPRLREVPDEERYGALPPSQAARGKTQTTVDDLTGSPAPDALDVDSVRAAIQAAGTVEQLREMWAEVKQAGLTAEATARAKTLAPPEAPVDAEPVAAEPVEDDEYARMADEDTAQEQGQ